jgi:AsmA protein
LRLALWSLAALVVVGAGVVFVAPLFISAEDVRNKLFAGIESATGYRLTVNGALHISAFPTLKLVAADVGVAKSAEGGDAADLATAKELRFGLALAPLLSGKVQVTEIVLVQPVIRVPEPVANSAAAANGVPPSGESSLATFLKNFGVDSLSIVNGTIILRGEGGAPGKRVEALSVEASLPSYDDPLSLDMKAAFNGQPVHVTGSVATFGPFLDGTAAQILLDIDAPAQFRNRLALTGSATYTGDVIALDALTAKAGETAVRGLIQADLSGAVPQIKATLNGDSLDLDEFLGSAAKASASSGDGAGGSGRSDAKIDFSPLRSVNAEVSVNVEHLRYGAIKAGPIGVRATAAGGKLKVELPNFQLYDGVGTGVMSVDATGKTPVQSFRFSLSNLDAYPFLNDAVGFQRIEGNAAIAIGLTTSGASQRAMMSALNGTAKFEFTDGAIRGINVAKMVRDLGSATLSGWQPSDAEKTDFASLGASFKVAQGKAQTNDLHLTGPLVRMAGAGVIDLAEQAVNLRVDPRVVPSLEGQGGDKDLQGLGVPVAINGPWAQPSIYPDIAGILENPRAAYERLSKLGGGLVKLPSSDALGATLSKAGGIVGLVQGKAGGSIEDLIQADQGTQRPSVVKGLGQLLGGGQPTAAATPAETVPAAPQPEQPAKKAVKKKQAKAGALAKPAGSTASQPIATGPAASAQPAAKPLMQNLFGGF